MSINSDPVPGEPVEGKRTSARLWARASAVLPGLLCAAAAVGIGLQLPVMLETAVDIVSIRDGSFGNNLSPPSDERARIARAFPATAADSQVTFVDLSEGDVAVLSYSADCAVCNNVIPRWLELIAALERQHVPVYVVGRAGAAADSLLWHSLGTHVTYVAATPDAMRHLVGMSGEPITARLSHGSLVAVYTGQIGPHRQARLVERSGAHR